MNQKIKFILNKNEIATSQHPGMSLLDYLRQEEHLTGTKEGCKEGDCGACTVLVGELLSGEIKYKSVNSCLLPIGDINKKHIVTIEGLNNEELTPIQSEMVDEGGTQCGFCTPGFVVSLSGYYLINDKYNTKDAVDSMNGNICRCTGYAGLKRTATKITSSLNKKTKSHQSKLKLLVNQNILPEYFLTVKEKLISINKKDKISTNSFDLDFGELSRVAHDWKNLTKNIYTISGGTDLMVQKWEDILRKDANLISSKKYNYINERKGKIIIGGMTTASEIENSEIMLKYFPSIKEYFSLFGSLPIKNKATVAGNIVNASPIADMTSIFLALNSELTLNDGKKDRTILLKDFYKGYKTLNKKENELLTEISFNVPNHSTWTSASSVESLTTGKNSSFNFEKVSKRKYLDIASVNSSIYIETKKDIISLVHLSAGGVAPIPLYLKNTCKFLTNQKINNDTLNKASDILQKEIFPISDARGTAEYKSLLLRQLFYAHFIKLFPKLIKVEELV